ncbi:PTS sugar transporter subunit IIA [Pradoshia sp.]
MYKDILSMNNIQLNVGHMDKEEAIRYTGQILVNQGYVEPSYIEKMLERERVTSTYMGNFVAIPHGVEESKKEVVASGISVVTVPSGVDFDGNTVKILIGIAGKGDEHLEILSQIAIVLSEMENIEKLISTSSKEEVINLFNEVN